VTGALLVARMGNSLRALIKHLDRLSDDEIVALNVRPRVR
jgi:bisphosphoglycerate-dependent phosphoglycerate mutase